MQEKAAAGGRPRAKEGADDLGEPDEPDGPGFVDGRPRAKGVRVLYVSPLKALGADVERNLQEPLAGVAERLAAQGGGAPPVRTGMRTGDTTPEERRALLRNPPDILITTPESLYLMLTSKARDILRTVDVVIVDEVHALAGNKRGAHLALSLERLDGLLERPCAAHRAFRAPCAPAKRWRAFWAACGLSAWWPTRDVRTWTCGWSFPCAT